MKNFIYKGFGIDGKGEISFKVSATEDTERPVLVMIFTSDQKLKVDFGEKFNEATVWVWRTSNLFCSGKGEDFKELWYSTDDDGSFDNYPREWKRCDNEGISRDSFETVPAAISWIKETVTERRDYWNSRRKSYKKISLEIREIKPEDLIIEGVEDVITLYEKRSKVK
jgi:hypothetical protein